MPQDEGCPSVGCGCVMFVLVIPSVISTLLGTQDYMEALFVIGLILYGYFFFKYGLL